MSELVKNKILKLEDLEIIEADDLKKSMISIDVAEIQFGAAAVQKADWLLIQHFLNHNVYRKVVEIGYGLSTELFYRFGLAVHSLETHPSIIKKAVKKDNINIVKWDGKEKVSFPRDINLAFIDGPFGGPNREFSYLNCICNYQINCVICHDVQREYDRKWIDKYFYNWNVYKKSTLRTEIYYKRDVELNG